MIALIEAAKNVGMKNTSSYFTDADFDIFKAQVDEAIQRAIDSGKTIVLPEDGIGTGKAQLKQRAPKLFNYLQNRLTALTVLGKRKELEDLFVKHLDGIQLQDGTIISNELTVDFLLEKLDEEAITIGFDNSTDRTDDAEIIEEVVEPETKSGIVLNTEQQTAVDGIVAHINSGNLEPVLLNGKAGTGKTTIIAEILKQVDPHHRV
jgi:tRNA A37 threonylcarbamoyladenosine biosynthesis protein TsaE